MKHTKKTIILVVAILASVVTFFIAPMANATLIEGINFPQGEDSFVKAVVDYIPGTGVISPLDDSTRALEIPDGTSMALGSAGTIILSFNENVLTTSGDSTEDLWIFERGTAESMHVYISVDGQTWISVGDVSGGTSGVDIDAFEGNGVIQGGEYRYVKLNDTDAKLTVNGADIDAVGAATATPPAVDLYASAVESYTAGTGVVSPFDDSTRAVGFPDATPMSLGVGGEIVLSFANIFLTTSGNSTNDLWIFERGEFEPTDVYVSTDGQTWISVGEAPGGTSGVDIDAFIGSGIILDEQYGYVKLIDTGTAVTDSGADIDAVGASSSTICVDNDGDGYGSPGSANCTNGFITDCDDTDPAINPGAVESYSEGSTCSDAVDNNCDGLTDTDDLNCKPDLVVTSISNPPAKRYRGTRFKILDVVTNNGADSGTSTTRYYLSKDEFVDSGDKLLKGSRAVPALISGATSGGLTPTRVKIPLKTRRGLYYLIGCADDINNVTEGYEGNNCTMAETRIRIK